MLTVLVILYVVAFLCTILSLSNPARVPLWVAVLLLCIAGLLTVLPTGGTSHSSRSSVAASSTVAA